MTNEEAIKIIAQQKALTYETDLFFAYARAIEALAIQEQIAVRPNQKDKTHFYCGACDKRLRLKHKPKYCPKCGIKIKWK